jgi:hypothetical protein
MVLWISSRICCWRAVSLGLGSKVMLALAVDGKSACAVCCQDSGVSAMSMDWPGASPRIAALPRTRKQGASRDTW